MAIPEESERSHSIIAPPSHRSSKAPSQVSKAPSQANGKSPSKAPSSRASQKAPSVAASRAYQPPPLSIAGEDIDGDATPRPPSPNELDQEEANIVRDALAGRTPRTSYYAASLEPEIANHFHDMELCVLLHQESDPNAHDFIKKALRKAVRQRVKKLGMKYDTEVGSGHEFWEGSTNFPFSLVYKPV